MNARCKRTTWASPSKHYLTWRLEPIAFANATHQNEAPTPVAYLHLVFSCKSLTVHIFIYTVHYHALSNSIIIHLSVFFTICFLCDFLLKLSRWCSSLVFSKVDMTSTQFLYRLHCLGKITKLRNHRYSDDITHVSFICRSCISKKETKVTFLHKKNLKKKGRKDMKLK